LIRPGTGIVAGLVLILLLAVGGVTWTTRHLAIPWTVDGPSMEPTLQPGDRVLVSLRAYRRRAPAVGDIVLLAGPSGVPMVKRIGKRPVGGRPPEDLLRARPGEPVFWVVGDHRIASDDSRRFGRVPRHRIAGKVVFRYWPLSRWGSIR
jgi:signal peptidase I